MATRMMVSRFVTTVLWLVTATTVAHGFTPKPAFSGISPRASALVKNSVWILHSKDEDDDESKENPYQDPNYPDLEFVDYSDPEYVVDQGIGDEFFDENETEKQIEAMREERRRRNDEFQFETYFRDILKSGTNYKGEWTVYKTDYSESDFPRFIKEPATLKVVSRGYKVIIDPNAEWRVDGERIRHEETAVSDSESEPYIEWQDDVEDETVKKLQEEIMSNTYWPDEMSSFDLRGHQGNMCVGNAYTICTSVGPSSSEEGGPFHELRTELGIESSPLRFRVKLDYRIQDSTQDKEFPPLHLKSLVVCRETHELWPRDGSFQSNPVISSSLFGAPGASGGLYDPPPVGDEEQSQSYMMLDLEGGATLLFPYKLEQHPEAFGGNGWVTSLDWSPGAMRYQVDRKVHGGSMLMGLRTLELSEVQVKDADTYRPRDGGRNMRQ